MTLVAVHEWKDAECDDCGNVFQVVKWIPLRYACCKTCGSLKIRRYYSSEERSKRNRRLAKREQGKGVRDDD